MKRWIALGLCCVMIMTACAAMAAEITVCGSGTVSAKPDQVSISTGCTVTLPSLREAQETMNGMIASARAGLEALGIAPDDILSTDYSYYPDYDYSGDTPRQTGYTASHSLNIVCRNTELLDEAVGVLTENGITSIWNISFGLGDTEALYHQALTLAYEQALARAKVLAEAAGYSSVTVRSVSESDGYSGGTVRYSKAAADEALSMSVSTGFHSGDVSVSASVSATFEME